MGSRVEAKSGEFKVNKGYYLDKAVVRDVARLAIDLGVCPGRFVEETLRRAVAEHRSCSAASAGDHSN